jgi:hypothetical protein
MSTSEPELGFGERGARGVLSTGWEGGPVRDPPPERGGAA